ncbi:hypothetical protein [Caulobacter endophyticus]|uniref:Protein activator of alkane oxidation PraB n=1 Tax=Caulobacter endophyticus TaxID=2172652 RepID=A0A2T9JSG0_9CAUL|nr:hypothetical protein [Caulobacter endophyticus]PVM86655.1 hypothetical protein DDF67_15100 [Caulobacter endophyticus]
MHRILCALTIGALALGGASAASAATFSPIGSPSPLSGTITFTTDGSPPYTCTLTLNASITGPTMTFPSGALSPPGFPCSAIVPTFTPAWSVNVTASSGGVATGLDIANFTLVTVFSKCSDTVQAQWNDATNTLTIPPQSFGIGYSGLPCTIQGVLATPTNVSITVP